MENASEDPNAPGALMLPPGEIGAGSGLPRRARAVGRLADDHVRKRDASNIALLLADEEETVSGFDAVSASAPSQRRHQHRGARPSRDSHAQATRS